jgi:hypothetical protein
VAPRGLEQGLGAWGHPLLTCHMRSDSMWQYRNTVWKHSKHIVIKWSRNAVGNCWKFMKWNMALTYRRIHRTCDMFRKHDIPQKMTPSCNTWHQSPGRVHSWDSMIS